MDILTLTEAYPPALIPANIIELVDKALSLPVAVGQCQAGAHGRIVVTQATADVLDAIDAALHKQDFDEIVLFTEPPGVSAWLKQDLVSRARRRFALPVTDVSTRPGGS